MISCFGPTSYAIHSASVCAVGRGTLADCIEEAFCVADLHAIDRFSKLENETDQIHARNGAWRLILWPPRLDSNPRFWPDYDPLLGNSDASKPVSWDQTGRKRHRVFVQHLSPACI